MEKYLMLKDGTIVKDEDILHSVAVVEGKPVFPGDVLWYIHADFGMKVTGLNAFNSIMGTIVENSACYTKGEDMWAPADCWTWTKPKLQKSGWINIYPDKSTSDIYSTKEASIREAMCNCIDTIQIEWEE